MKKFWILLTIPSLMAYADGTEEPSQSEAVLAVEEEVGTPFVATEQPTAPPPVSVKGEKSPLPFFVEGEYLWLRVFTEGLLIGSSVNDPLPAPSGNAFSNVSQTAVEIDPGFSSGFRVGLGGFPSHDEWETRLDWMWYENSASLVSGPVSGNNFTTNLLCDNQHPAPSSATANWSLRMNVIDLLLSRSFGVARFLDLEPSVAIRQAWVFQKLYVNYQNVSFNLGPSNVSSVPFSRHSFLNGTGLRVGLGTKWKCCENFSAYANGAASLLWGQIKTSQYDDVGSGSINYLRDSLVEAVPVLELSVGVAWDWVGECAAINIHAGWEQDFWFNEFFSYHYSLYDFNAQIRKNPLGLAGLQVGTRISF